MREPDYVEKGYPVTWSCILPEGVCTDLQLMTIWVESFKHFRVNMTPQQLAAVSEWFAAYVANEVE